MSSRLNARIDENLAQRLAAARRVTGMTTTEIVRRAVDRFCAEVEAGPASSAALLASCGFVGCAEGPEDLAETAKEALRTSLSKKL